MKERTNKQKKERMNLRKAVGVLGVSLTNLVD